ncbi:MAG: HDOD domain-containing protein [Desulfobulbaceae bacterium]|nr:HDOD domain-containing protein [Desulfobulbaceae bacterium]
MKIQDLLDKVGDLPTLPTIANQINLEMQKNSLTAKSLGKIISTDTSLSAKVLRVANSAFYGLPREVTSLDKAVMVIGFDAVKNIALSISIFSLFEKEGDSFVDVSGLWLHSIGCGVSAKNIVEVGSKQLGDDAFLMGILHDIGKVVLISKLPDDMKKVIDLMTNKEMNQRQAELEIFGFSHDRVGSLLLQNWNFPPTIVQTVKFHHKIEFNEKNMDEHIPLLIHSLFIGNQIAKILGLGLSTDMERVNIPEEVWSRLKIKREQLPLLRDKIKNQYDLLTESWKREGLIKQQ